MKNYTFYSCQTLNVVPHTPSRGDTAFVNHPSVLPTVLFAVSNDVITAKLPPYTAVNTRLPNDSSINDGKTEFVFIYLLDVTRFFTSSNLLLQILKA